MPDTTVTPVPDVQGAQPVQPAQGAVVPTADVPEPRPVLVRTQDVFPQGRKAPVVRPLPAVGELEPEETSILGPIKAIARRSDTLAVWENIRGGIMDEWLDYDPEFNPDTSIKEAAQAFNLPVNSSTREALAGAGTQSELMDRAAEYRKNLDDAELVARHGGLDFVGQIIDPVWLGATFATLGFARFAQAGRIAAGALEATTTVGVTAAADTGDTSAEQYVLNAAMAGGIGALLGKSARPARALDDRAPIDPADWADGILDEVPNVVADDGVAAIGPGAVRAATGAPASSQGSAPGLNQPAPQAPPKTFAQQALSKFQAARASVNEFTTEFDRLVMPDKAGGAKRGDMLSALVDDPLVRPEYVGTAPATASLRVYRNQADGLLMQYEQELELALKKQGFNRWQRLVDTSGKVSDARANLEKRVHTELVSREATFRRTGNVVRGSDETVNAIADKAQVLHDAVADIGNKSGLRGFEDLVPVPGYVHRSWNAAAVAKYPKQVIVALLSAARRRQAPGLDKETADMIGTAVYDRAKAKLRNESLSFFGSVGQADTDMIEEMLKNSDAGDAVIEGVMRRLRQNLDEVGTIKYAKERIDFDMTTRIKLDDGTTLGMMDLIDSDVGRIMSDYSHSVTGRSALAKAGIGGDEPAIRKFRDEYADTLAGLPDSVRTDRLKSLEGLFGDFTGLRPPEDILSPGLQHLKSLTDSAVLGASGTLQVAQYADMGAVYGVRAVASEFIKSFPGVGTILKAATKSPDLADELATVLNLDLGRDVRWHPWMRQHDVNLMAKDTKFARILHAGRQATPYLNAMLFVHRNQSRMNANLALNTIARAAAGSRSASKLLREFGATDAQLKTVVAAAKKNVTYSGKNAKSMNWGAWSSDEVDSALDVALRIMDTAVIYGRPGQGIGSRAFGRSQAGQLLGHLRSFVALAHNKLLRGTLARRGWTGLGMMLAYQYPMSYVTTAVNEVRAGRGDDIEPGAVALKAIGYTSGLGLVGDALGVLGITNVRGGFGVPITAPFQAAPLATKGLGAVLTGDTRSGSADLLKAASYLVPAMGVFPGTQIAIDAVRGD